MPPVICPSCGEDDTEPTIGRGYICEHCGHVFQVINGQQVEFDEDDDGA